MFFLAVFCVTASDKIPRPKIAKKTKAICCKANARKYSTKSTALNLNCVLQINEFVPVDDVAGECECLYVDHVNVTVVGTHVQPLALQWQV